MALICNISSILRRVASRYHHSPLLYASTWTILLIVTVLVAALAPMFAFILAISEPWHFSDETQHGDDDGGFFIRVPLDFPRDMLYLPQQAVMISSHMDFFLPTLFAALTVAASACFLRAIISST